MANAVNYYYADSENRPVGPVSVSELQRLRSDGTIRDETWVIEENAVEWRPLQNVLGHSRSADQPASKDGPLGGGTKTGTTELVLHGRQGKTLIVAGDVIRIEKESLLTGKRGKTILIRNVTSVEVKKPGAFVVGFIQFSIAGGKARDSSFTLTGGAYDAVQDENSVVFAGQEKYETALKVKAYVESWSPTQATRIPQSGGPMSAADEIRKLKGLVDDGLITAEEFERKRKQLLAL